MKSKTNNIHRESIDDKIVDDLLSEIQAADILGLKAGTLRIWRSNGRYKLPFIKVGSRVRYRRADLAIWLHRRTRESGATE